MTERQTDLFAALPREHRNEAATLLERVRAVMTGAEWWTLHQIACELERRYDHTASDASISARLRDLRKAEHGAWIVERRRSPASKAPIYQYRLTRGIR